MDRRPYEAVQALRGRRCDTEGTAPLRHRLLEMIWAARGGQELRTEPGDQCRAIGDGGFAEAHVLPNLRAVPLDGPTVPVILRPGGRGHADLLSEMVHHGEGHLLRCTRELPRVLEELAQHRNHQARRALLGLDARPVLRAD